MVHAKSPHGCGAPSQSCVSERERSNFHICSGPGMRGCGLRDVLESRPGSFGGGRGRRPQIPPTTIISVLEHSRTGNNVQTPRHRKGGQGGPARAWRARRVHWNKLQKPGETFPRGRAAAARGLRLAGLQPPWPLNFPSARKLRPGPARPARAQAPGPAGKADRPPRPQATGFPTGSRRR